MYCQPLLFGKTLFCDLQMMNQFAVRNFHVEGMKGLFHGEKYSQQQGSCNRHVNFLHANKCCLQFRKILLKNNKKIICQILNASPSSVDDVCFIGGQGWSTIHFYSSIFTKENKVKLQNVCKQPCVYRHKSQSGVHSIL